MTIQDRDRVTIIMLKQYQKLRHAVMDADGDIESGQLAGTNYDGRVQCGIGDPTARGCCKHMAADKAHAWVIVIDQAMEELRENSPMTAEIVSRHFRMRYTAGYDRKKMRGIRVACCNVYHIGEKAYYLCIGEGVDTVRQIAGENGLFSDF